ncbi:MAG: hypothetical protein AAF389_02700 [Gemmatimonadota bacterium]
MKTQLLVSPSASGAYFGDVEGVCLAEFSALLPDVEVTQDQVGALHFLKASLEPEELRQTARMSFVQGAFEDGGTGLHPLPLDPDFLLPPELVFGSSYRGKTHPLVTQLALNLALHYADTGRPATQLLDPMAGMGTTLLWGLRYGLDGWGIEQDRAAADGLHRHVKRQTKLHRIKHRHAKGFTGAKNRRGEGAFVDYEMGGHTARLVTGDTVRAETLLERRRFDMIVCDLPYGVQFKGKGQRVSDLVAECVPVWVDRLRPGGAMVLIFNTYQPHRNELAHLCTGAGCAVESFAAPHRMSESIVRDLLVATRPRGGGSPPSG